MRTLGTLLAAMCTVALAQFGPFGSGAPLEESVAETLEVVPLVPSPVESLMVADTPNDAGNSLDLFWTLSIDEGLASGSIVGYEVYRAASGEGPFTLVATLGPGTDRYRDRTVREGQPYFYRIRAIGRSGTTADSPTFGPVAPKGQWVHRGRLKVLAALVVIVLVVGVTRRLPADQEWVLPAVRTLLGFLGRKESGPLVFVPGTGGLGRMGTIASFTLLEQVMRAREGEPVVAYVPDPLVHAFLSDEVRGLDSRFICPDEAVFSLAFTGEALRTRPSLGLVVGEMGSEAFLLCEGLRRSGATTVGGTPDVPETPFLLSACNLTLIGEELFLAGAVLAPEGCRAAPLVQDRLKTIAWFLILLGVVAAKLGIGWYVRLFSVVGD